jgi:formylglycine-generating enzyme required for sulfatase activity
MRIRMALALVGAIGLAAVAGLAGAQSVPQLIVYQGRLTNSTVQPLADGSTVDLTFKFYGVQSGQTPLYLTVLQKNVLVTGGLYNVLIGSGTVTAGAERSLAEVFQKHAEVWLGVKVDADQQMTPRARIASVPYAMTVDPRYVGDIIAKPDWDGDGYPKTGNPPDCNDGDPLTHPGAPEICTDGYDNDCDGTVDANDPDCWVTPPGMALIPAGCFNMGDAFGEGNGDERPVHNVCLSSHFYLDVHEVTNAEYAACVSGGGCTAPWNLSSYSRASYYGNPAYNDFPVIYVDWNQAKAYCTWAGKRLPTEAQWEYAARGGLSGGRYSWGDTMIGTEANYYQSGDPWDNDTSPVGYYAANGYGLYDLAGNVWEWTNDWYLDTYYGARPNPDNDPAGPASGTNRVYRGGGWGGNIGYLRVSVRHNLGPTLRSSGLGFRCAGD